MQRPTNILAHVRQTSTHGTKCPQTPGKIPELIFGVGANIGCIEKAREKYHFVPAVTRLETGWTVPGSGDARVEIQ
jgi:hypothetical protein